MARDRQRAKQRQAERRAARLASTRPEGAPPEGTQSDPPQPRSPRPDAPPERAPAERDAQDRDALEQAELAAGAPPSDLGFSDATLEAEEAEDLAEADLEADELDAYDEVDAEALAGDAEPAERRRARAQAHGRRRHNRLISFLIAVWAELRRVEWPDRQTLTMLTGVVLLFVIVMGAYLGLLDAVFSKIIDKIL
jgi:preprotein translocase subunit SecE